MKLTFVSFLMMIGAFVFGANPTITTSVFPTRICSGDVVMVIITPSDTFNPGNKFRVQLSDSTGAFSNRLTVLDSVFTQGTDTLYITMPVVAPGTRLLYLRRYLWLWWC
jgi:hypothetical protein